MESICNFRFLKADDCDSFEDGIIGSSSSESSTITDFLPRRWELVISGGALELRALLAGLKSMRGWLGLTISSSLSDKVIDFSRLAFSSLSRVDLAVNLAAPASFLPLGLFLVASRPASSSLSLS